MLAPSVFIKDLYVSAQVRSGGIGRRLMVELARLAMAEGWRRIDWNADTPNTRAIAFYEHLADCRLDKAYFRLQGDAIAKVARGDGAATSNPGRRA